MKLRKLRHALKKKPTKIVLLVSGLLLMSVGVFVWHEHQASAPYNPTAPAETNSTEKPTSVTEPTQPSPSPRARAFDKSSYSTSDPTSPWVVVNKQNPLQPLSYTPSDLVGVGNGQVMRSAAAGALTQLLRASARAGQPVSVLSAYRSYATQSAVYNNYVRSDGQANADTYSARPGHSEHQTGLAVDVGNGSCDLLECFGDTTAGVWLADNAHTYGFIIRYPKGNSAVTGYQYEPWHLRYVGTSLATEMHAKAISTLEEFFGVPGGTSY